MLFGLAFILIPGPFTELCGEDLTEGGLNITRLLGAAFIGFAVLTWQAREANDSRARRAILLAFLISFSLGFIISLISQVTVALNAIGWSTVVIYLLFAAAYGYFQFKQPE